MKVIFQNQALISSYFRKDSDVEGFVFSGKIDSVIEIEL